MKIKEIIPLYEALTHIVKEDSKTTYNFSVQTRLNLLKNYKSIKDSFNYFLDLRDSIIKETNPNITENENGESIVSLKDSGGEEFLEKLGELLELEIDDIDIKKVTYEQLLGDSNSIPLEILDKLSPMIEEK
jgi:hypothetical protein